MIVAGRVVTPAGAVSGWIETAGEHIAEVGGGLVPSVAAGSGQWTIVAGFVDLHVHGGGGHSFTAGDPDAVVHGIEFHLRHGTTTTLLSLVTAPADELEAAARRVSGWLGDAGPGVRRHIAGIHFEGPFLSVARCGAQDPEFMSDPDPEIIDGFVAAAGGHLRMMTIAPERQGAIDAIVAGAASS